MLAWRVMLEAGVPKIAMNINLNMSGDCKCVGGSGGPSSGWAGLVYGSQLPLIKI